MINARSKGQVGEREVADMLNAIIYSATTKLGDFKRNLQQTQDGGFDLFSVEYPHFAIEVKRVEALTPAVIEKFWEQTLRQSKRDATRPPLLPILIYRKNRTPWRIRMHGTLIWSADIIVVDISLEDFRAWFRAQIIAISGV